MNVNELGELMQCGVIRITRDRTIVSSNRIMKEWLGGALQENLDEALAPGGALFWETTIGPMLLQSGRAMDVALDFAAPDRTVSLVGNLVAEGDEVIGLFLRFDVRREFERAMAAAEAKTKQQEQEIAQLQKLNRMRLDFINSAAHEIATPLTPIYLQLHILKGQGADPTPLASIQRNLNSLKEFSEDLRNAAALEGMEAMPKLAQLDVLRAVQALTKHVEGPSTLARADENWLRIALEKLLENAEKFCADSTVKVLVRDHPPRVIVSDDGVGIDPKHLSKLGQPFAQFHDKSKFTMLGPGLGLYIATHAAKLMGGKLELESPGLDKGFTATLVLAE